MQYEGYELRTEKNYVTVYKDGKFAFNADDYNEAKTDINKILKENTNGNQITN